jgi:addiction module RelE/StbE family toxin
MRIRWTERAIADLTAVRDYISKDSPDAAARVAAKLLAATHRLEQFPQSGRMGRLKGTRELVVHGLPYVVPYRVVDDMILILSVIHTSRRWPKKL